MTNDKGTINNDQGTMSNNQQPLIIDQQSMTKIIDQGPRTNEK